MTSREADRLHVLVVDDDEQVRGTLVKLLDQEGFAPHGVANGMEAFAAIETTDFRVILLDIRMPRLGGMAFFQQLEERLPKLAGRVIFVTAFAHSAEIAGFLRHSGQPVFEKPYDTDRLMEAVRVVASRRDSFPLAVEDDSASEASP